ncbi:hypothetical protein KGD82_24640 [Nocardiopsis eucommiae]|uniref:Uncharacterized protein n=1 Tax=Nocardiopsis eucommiae TaxID=2831970 RepID=A0A975QKA1_9ACTN|nr:hypothetical protein KGD82_24640 [Nocardiopsis eucommiae]
MYTARISPSDPRAFASLRAVLHDPRHAGTDLYLHLEPGLYTEPHCLEITTRVMVVPVAGPGSVEIAVQGDDSVFAVAGERASLELYGVHVRGAAGHPGVRTAPGTRFRAIDTVFSSGSLKIHGDGTEIVNCRFEDGGSTGWAGRAVSCGTRTSTTRSSPSRTPSARPSAPSSSATSSWEPSPSSGPRSRSPTAP